MCYSTSIDQEAQGIERAYNRKVRADVASQLPIYFATAFARPLWPVITAEQPGEVQGLQWGLVPSWAKDPALFLRKSPTFNARSEEAHGKPSFRGALKAGQRCLILATGGFESMTVNAKLKVPHFFHLRSRPLFAFAGIYDGGGYSMLTTKANALFEHIHNQPAHSADMRMPVILPRELEEAWLQPHLTEADALQLCVPYPADDMEAWPVDRKANQAKAQRNVPDITSRVEYAEL